VYRQDFERCPHDGATLLVGANDPWIGLSVGSNYVVEALIGEGAMGRVYRAHHRQFRDRRYAIKILIGDLAAQAQMRARFALEAEHAKKLSHPNVVGVIDFGITDHGVNYMVMELVEGPTLGALLRQGPMDAERVIRFARQICEGLDHAHGRGTIHRDLKPDNILVLSEREHEIARIADFGLALSKNDETRLTTTGVVCTPAYASPEQLRGEAIDHRVDLYALGTTMYEMLTGGILPFNGDVDGTVTAKLTSEAPSVLLNAPNVPPALVALVGRLLSPQPERRPRTARAVIRALDQALSAPRAAMKTDETARLRARAMTGASRPLQAEAYQSLKLDVPTRKNRVRRTTVQLLACGLTLSGVLAWADLHGTTPVRAEPALEVIAESEPAPAAADLVVGLRDTPYASVGMPVTIPSELVLARQVSFAGLPMSRVIVDAAPAVVAPAPVVEAAPIVKQAKRARPVRRPKARRVVSSMPREAAPVVDVVEQMLDAAVAPTAPTAPAEPTDETVEVPGATATPAAAAPVPPPRDAYDEPLPGEAD
jgi:proline-rich tail region repeat protein